MHTGCLLIALAAVGVETGWQPLDRGGLEYIIQIEPSLLDALESGEAITSEIPPSVEGVRRYRIVVGREPVPRVGAKRPSVPADPAPSPLPGAASNRPAAAEPARYPGPEAARLVQAEHADGPSINLALPPPPADDERPHIDPRLPAPPDHRSEDHAHQQDPTHQPAPAALPGNRYGAPASEQPPASVAFPGIPPVGVPNARDSAKEDRRAPPSVNRSEPPVAQPAQQDANAASMQKKVGLPTRKPADGAEHAPPEASRTAPIAETPASDTDHSAASTADSKPWMPLFFTLIALFASLGGNLYLGWIAWDSRQHYQQIVRQRRAPS